jgi:hypothetical protein
MSYETVFSLLWSSGFARTICCGNGQACQVSQPPALAPGCPANYDEAEHGDR